MKTIYLVRHSYASKNFQGRDYDRPLKTKGIEVAKFIGEELHKNHIHPDFIIASEAVRTFETANILSDEVGYPENKVITDKKLYEANEADMLNKINRIDNKYQTVFMVGHNPTISGMVSYLSGESPIILSPGSVIGISFDLNQWGLISFNTGKIIDRFLPRSYEQLNNIID